MDVHQSVTSASPLSGQNPDGGFAPHGYPCFTFSMRTYYVINKTEYMEKHISFMDFYKRSINTCQYIFKKVLCNK